MVDKVEATWFFAGLLPLNSCSNLSFSSFKGRKKSMGPTFSSDDIVIKSPNDRRLYRLLELENGLHALRVHDPEIYSEGPYKAVRSDDEENEEDEDEEVGSEEGDGDGDEDGSEEADEYDFEDVDGEVAHHEAERKGDKAAPQTKKAAVAMCVGMGSFSDPFEAQGLAHFLEHMLFMGGAEFPDENEASIAKLETSVSFVSDKLELKVHGFNDKLTVLLSKLLSVARTFMPTDDRFKVIKEDMKRTLKNSNMKPLSHSSYLRLQVLCKSFYDVDERLSHLNNLFLDDLKAFFPIFVPSFSLKAFAKPV